jgi:predicted dienelactone hydrolase
MKRISLFLVLFITLSSFGQTFEVGTAQYTFNDSERNRSIPAVIYYPSPTGGQNAPVANSQFGFPVISFGHGFVIEPEAYSWLGEELAAEGYIFVLPATEGQLLPAPDHLNFGRDILFCAKEIIRLSGLSGNPLSGKVLPRFALMGHSMGGGATYLGAAESDEVSTTITFAAAETNPSAISASANVAVPSLVFAAEEDCVTPVSSNQLPIYDNLPSAEKAFANIDNASHCNFTDGSASLCYLGEALPCLGSSFISIEQQHERVLSLLLPWLDQFLRADCSSGEAFTAELEAGTTDNQWVSQISNPAFFACAESCEAPQNLSVIEASSGFELSWDETEDALGYQVQARLNGTSLGSTNSFISSLTVSQLDNDQDYEFRVRAFCPVQGLSSFSTWSGLQDVRLSLEGSQELSLVYEEAVIGSTIFVRNMQGEVVGQIPVRSTSGFSTLSALPKGLYIATVNGKRRTETMKFSIR